MSHTISDKVRKLHNQFQIYGKNAREWMRKCALLLPEIQRERVWEKKGFGSIYEYASKLAGMSKHTVDESLRVLNAIEDKPALMHVAVQKGIQILRPIATIATQENATFWAEKATSMSKPALETYVHEIRKQQVEQQRITSEASQLLPRVKPTKQITMELDEDVASQLEQIKGNDDWNQLMQELLRFRQEKFEQKQRKIQQEHPAATEASSRHIPAAIMRHLLQRSRGRCEYPGCHRKFDIIHHARRFALEQAHNPAHMVLLCTAHERLAHMSLINHENEPISNWHIRTEPDKTDPKYAIDLVVMKHRSK